MKELSIEEKAKRYDESIARAKKLKETCDSTTVVGWCEYIFKELRESEDEKIRKEILLYFTSQDIAHQYVNDKRRNRWAAWLEKQKSSEQEIENWTDEEVTYIKLLEGLVKDRWHKAERENDNLCVNKMSDLLFFLKTIKKKQGESKFEQCIQEGDKIVSNEDGTHFNVSQLERVSQKVTDTKETAKKFLKTAGIMDKNGEQLAEEYMQEKSSNFHIGDAVKIHCCGRPKHIQDIYNNKVGNIDCIWDLNKNPWGNIGVRLENGCNNLFFESELEIVAKTEKIMDGNETDEKIVEALKDTSILDLVEPKFKSGDWVVDTVYDKAMQILFLEDDGYEFENGIWISYTGAKERIHLWTIKDAKDGDVLVTVDGKRPFIYKGCLDPNHPDSPVAYCGINTERYFCKGGDNFDHWWTDAKVQPATKEQRDLLFSKMKEAGYEWNADKKELKKIHVIDEGKAEMDYCFTKMMNGEKINSAWSEDDEVRIREIIEYLNELYDKYRFDLNELNDKEHWLKSLKEKLHPQWKPSEEQIQALEYQVNSTYKGSWQYKASKELLEQIKKL